MLDADGVRVALLQEQYFPHVRKDREELPPIFSSKSFTIDAAEMLAQIDGAKGKRKRWIEFRTRRFDGLVRRLGVPHPVPYSRLVLHIAENWSEIEAKLGSEKSLIKPEFHRDGRLVHMDYETSEDALRRDTRLAQGQQFLVKADISSCFPSIYSHALDWALRGKAVAKAASGNDVSWQAGLDTRVRHCHDGETKGVMIGPAVSNLLAELVLQRVDEQLGKKYSFVRYVDDYAAYCGDRTSAEQFVVDLQHALAEYRLDLNHRKTKILDLRDGFSEPWIAELLAYLPHKWTALAAARYLRHCEMLAHRFPTSSVLKFAVKHLNGQREREDADPSLLVVDELVRLCAFHPHLAPFVSREVEAVSAVLTKDDKDRLAKELTRQLAEAGRRSETDVVLWHLYTLRRVLLRTVKKSVLSILLAMEDDLVFLGMAELCTEKVRLMAAERVRDLDYNGQPDRDSHWLSRYEFHRVGLLASKDLDPSEQQWINVLKKRGVQFCLTTK